MNTPPARPRIKGRLQNCGNSGSFLCLYAAQHRAERAAKTALNPVWTRSAESTQCGGIDATLALPLAATSEVGFGGAGDHNAARLVNQPENRSSADRSCHAKSERPSGRRRSRAGGRLRVSPLVRSRATLKLKPRLKSSAANFVPYVGRSAMPVTIRRSIVRSVTSAATQYVEPANQRDDTTAKLHHSVRGRALLTR